jgi:uncharacterized protein YndB with AHSA1/START domain
MEKNKIVFVKDLPNKKITVEREFAAPVADVWRAWTESKILDQWWAPHPWRAETKTMNFKEGGYWLYAMIGPQNERHWSKAEFIKINNLKNFEAHSYFCDENGTKNPAMEAGTWNNNFTATATGTKVIVVLSFSSEKHMAMLVEMGFEAGFTAGLGNLDEFLEKQKAAI